jgi:hypothetical protein
MDQQPYPASKTDVARVRVAAIGSLVAAALGLYLAVGIYTFICPPGQCLGGEFANYGVSILLILLPVSARWRRGASPSSCCAGPCRGGSESGQRCWR